MEYSKDEIKRMEKILNIHKNKERIGRGY